jgi:hypothetical protein
MKWRAIDTHGRRILRNKILSLVLCGTYSGICLSVSNIAALIRGSHSNDPLGVRLDGPKSVYRYSRVELSPCVCWELSHVYPFVKQFFA